jgi:TetR/AcrR family transcriptional regulator, transcriptional repressor for nem operon
LTVLPVPRIDYEHNQKMDAKMVKVTKAVSAANAADVLKAAGQVMRAEGTGAATMANIAAKAGLTHGAVYRHFDNKDALAAAAISADFDHIVTLLQGIARKGGGASSYARTYLTMGHRDHFDWGCPIAPLASEIHRDEVQIQTAFCEGLNRNIDALADCMGDQKREERRRSATVVLAALSGSMAMARATKQCDPQLSAEIMTATAAMIESFAP